MGVVVESYGYDYNVNTGRMSNKREYSVQPYIVKMLCRPKRPVKGAALVCPPLPNMSLNGRMCNHVRPVTDLSEMDKDGWKTPVGLAAQVYRAAYETPANDHYNIMPPLKSNRRLGVAEKGWATSSNDSLTEALRVKAGASNWPDFLQWWEDTQGPKEVASWVNIVKNVDPDITTTVDALMKEAFLGDADTMKQVKLFKLS